MSKRISKQLVIDALIMALWRRKPPRGLIFHSDRPRWSSIAAMISEVTQKTRHTAQHEQERRFLG